MPYSQEKLERPSTNTDESPISKPRKESGAYRPASLLSLNLTPEACPRAPGNREKSVVEGYLWSYPQNLYCCFLLWNVGKPTLLTIPYSSLFPLSLGVGVRMNDFMLSWLCCALLLDRFLWLDQGRHHWIRRAGKSSSNIEMTNTLFKKSKEVVSYLVNG